MFVEERLAKIQRLLKEKGQVGVDELALMFDVSKETVRRDLARLKKESGIIRTHGGAVLSGTAGFSRSGAGSEPPAPERFMINAPWKDLIGRRAAAFVESGDTLFVDNSTTCVYMYPYIPKELQITILTNSLQFMLECAKDPSPSHTVVCLGGILKTSNLSLCGELAAKNALGYYPTKAFVSCTGILSEDQVTDMGVQEIEVKRALMKASRQVFLLADHTKFGTAGQVYLSPLSGIDRIITDEGAALDYFPLSPENRGKIIFA